MDDLAEKLKAGAESYLARVRCSACGIVSDQFKGGRYLLGTDDRLCFDCFNGWYDYGCRTLEDCRKYTLDLREKADD